MRKHSAKRFDSKDNFKKETKKSKEPKRATQKSKEKKTHKKTLKFISIFILLALILAGIYFAFNYCKNKSTSDDYAFSKIEEKKYVEGIDTIEILSVALKDYDNHSIIEISLKNKSAEKFNGKRLHLYLYGNNNLIFGTAFNLKEIEANSETNSNIFCTTKIEHITDYKISVEE